MKSYVLAALVATLFGMSGAVAAAEAAPAAAAASAPERTAKVADDKEQVICRREKVTGSRFARNLCHTREQWEAMRKAGVEGTGNIQRAPIPIVSE